MMRKMDSGKRFYLAKNTDDSIFIEKLRIPQHHIDGIRFLYRQFKKKKPGVIINEVIEYSKNVQIVLFLKALSHILKQPVLILCQEGAERGWVEQFQMWTELGDEVIVEAKKPYIKKQVLIHTMTNSPTFCNRNWSLLIVDSPEIDKAQQVLTLPFKANFKIWITPLSMKKNLDQFAKIYKWFYPKGDFDLNQYTPNRNDLRDVVDKAIMLDAFMEDIVAWNVAVDSAAENVQKEASPISNKSIKNKDPTGTKVKRSKRKIYDDDDDDIPLSKSKKDQNNEIESETINKNNLIAVEPVKRSKRVISDRDDDDIPLSNAKKDSLKRAEEPISKNQEDDHDLNIDNKRQNKESQERLNEEESDSSQVTLFYEPDLPNNDNSDRLYEMDTLVLDESVCDEQRDNINESVEASDNNCEEKDEDICKDINLGKNDRTSEEKPKHSTNNDIFPAPSSIFEIKSENNDVNEENSPSICDDIKQKINELSTTKVSSTCDEIKLNINKLIINKESPTIGDDDEVTPPIDEEIETNHNEGDKPTLNNTSFEDKVKEMEEKAMKKFKGSIFDTLF